MRFDTWESFTPYYDKTHEQIQLSPELTTTPEDTLLHYFSILREAVFIGDRGCGSIGQGSLPFPLAYNFLSKEYQKKLSYEDYLQLFTGIRHTSLIKLCRVPDEKRGIKFFYEVETIEGSESKKAEYFGYSYGFIMLAQENEGYRISDLSRMEEDFLCAPYHGWSHDAEAVVEVKYGNWCKLIHKKNPTIAYSYVKKICFRGNDGVDYCMIFFTLTNGTDVEIAQFRKARNEIWKQFTMHPEEECLTENREIL
ncbi:hypothetical protein [Neobacillus cucumis]|uniref:hypothetical protein n=1 Tax=Neobacillus cucumis TaxID=1740721 RepID=UPI0015E0D230|nr:hypothetical protein [Neobacillus cucumis]